MKELTVINKNGVLLTDSREVAEMVGKEHKNLLRDIQGYIKVIEDSSKLSRQDFFIESTYQNSQNKTQPCYLLTKQGCEMVANKMTGEKGILFTAEYVKRFNIMEECIKEAVKENEYTLEDKIAKLLSVLPEAERGEYMLKLVDRFYPKKEVDKIIKEKKDKPKIDLKQKAIDIFKECFDKAYYATRGQYILFYKEPVYKCASKSGITKREFNKILLEYNMVKTERGGELATCCTRIDNKNYRAIYLKANLLNN